MDVFTPTQGRYLAYIHAYIEGFGEPPAESEIAKALKVSPPSANQMMKTLEAKGFISRKAGMARSIRILLPIDQIPQWNARKLSRVVRGWFPSNTSRRKVAEVVLSENAASSDVIYQFKITLLKTNPPIWRRIETPDVGLVEMHGLIQTAMGWTNSHMHQFHVGKAILTSPRFLLDDFEDGVVQSYADVKISDLVPKKGKLQMIYEYDFGDGWMHQIDLEKSMPAEQGIKYPRCTDGARACPPEDIGGVWGYADLLLALADRKHPDHRELLEIHGPFDPDKFDAVKATRMMKRGLPKW